MIEASKRTGRDEQALQDVLLVLNGTVPNTRNYWVDS